jgi:hydroxymethylpyrimidine pyrophosphatase-like HAD family hydrolase
MAAGVKVAMGNATSEIKAVADHVAPSVDNDGLVWVIEEFFR